ncbi:hypothetical protein FSW04_07840 [Baekduia soli]|uniref:Uncharacterized protein n=1 Tax=Baekduia soli TaxID=496014 RepID=A0A5B8U381_9ACTN|nr:hypothetical protein [Baekduia soli]QEC47496.1 hypothetical protein FSW04_07840 [Baekduia soli]
MLARRRRLILLLAPLVVVFLAVSFVVARFLTTENRERAKLDDLLHLEAAGDVGGVLRSLQACDAACAAKVRAFVPRLAGPGAVKIARLDSGTSYSLGTAQGWSRVVWVRGVNAVPVVQCVLVRRSGSPLTGRSISLLRLNAPLANNEDPC